MLEPVRKEVSQFGCHFHEFCSWLWVRLGLCCVWLCFLLMFSCGLVKLAKEVVSGRDRRGLSHFLLFLFWGQV